MLNALRKAAGSWVAKILFVLLIISFAAWGIGDFLRPSADEAVAEVGGSKISPEEYRSAFNRELDRLRQRFGPNLTQELAVQLGLADQVLSQLVEQHLHSLEAHDLGVRIGDDVVVQWIMSQEGFQDAAGRFDRDRFHEALAINGMTEEGFVALLRGDLLRRQVADAVTAGVAVPASLAEAIYLHRQELRTAEILFVPASAAGPVPDPSEADLAAYYEGNKERYSAPEYRSVTAVLLRPEDVAAEIAVPDDRLREAYQNRLAEFQTPETRDVSQILFANEAKAKAAYEKLRAGETFDAVAAEAKDAQRTDIGPVKRGDLFPESVEAAAFALSAPGITEPVQSPLGWHILRVASITPASTKPFDAVRDQLRGELAHEEAGETLLELSNQLEDTLAGGATLDEAAQKLNLKLLKIPAMDRSGRDEAGLAIPDLPGGPTFLTAAFETYQGELSRLTETPDGGYFILRVDAVKPSQVRPLEAVRDRVLAEWRTEQARKLALAEAETIAERVRGGATLAAEAEAHDLQTQTTPPFTRQTNSPAERLPADLVAKLFAAAPGDVAVGQMPDGAIVARLAEIKPADPAADSEQIAALRSDLTQRMQSDFLAQYDAALQKKYGVTVNQTALQRMF